MIDYKGIKYIFFDLDGTIFDSMKMWSDVDISFLRRRGLDVPEDYMDKVSVLSMYSAALYTIDFFKLKDTPEDLMKEWHEMASYEYANNIEMKPYALDYLKKMKERGYVLAIVTSSDKTIFNGGLKRHGIENMFDYVFTPQGLTVVKGDGSLFNKAVETVGANKQEVLVFEDAYEAIVGAKTAGLKVVGVKTDYTSHKDEEFEKICDYRIESFKELL